MKRYEDANSKEQMTKKKRRNSTMGLEGRDSESVHESSKALPRLRTSLSPSIVDFKYKGNTRDVSDSLPLDRTFDSAQDWRSEWKSQPNQLRDLVEKLPNHLQEPRGVKQ